ncbi:Stk1 family PASTA domain-containing Ser/Thr kinase [Amycolatopsis rubida]|uniref:non-specific serine/threonine protein kinase n=1 Tax=Amycolatopsis rubida TaxID=112413 RepID=A0A1I5F0N5_9PSEU|nr:MULTISPECIES: Stk1 family PASTA domain-containing Ser/Thr kinase [Amycolatopsis]MYW94446.1 Stk1 family PASTA domain-containing Ser/Thr kinase [Amycolatopsis rubida]NEC59434.1 Stk1 family PASTA domain-containing Ser/Thr kinase [Amycolatopsis rubida]OAP27156.1 Serine/threonine-protein kinase PknB [Amycolatopsis sp. M39]SFO17243.1 serine/threonine protein kinase [Amycolatopsis rubida]
MTTPRLLSNRYELGDTLGYGGMSEVHHGHDVRLGREVAIKVLRADLARDPQFQERFRREAQNAAALNHPAIVAVYDTGEANTDVGPLPYIVMEYVEGRTLRDIVKTEGPLSQKRAMEVMADVCAALDFSHRHGIVHRDVKPANVMITKNGAVKVMDFGIARAMHDGQSAMTQTAAVIGTAQYLSPEQARGESVDARSDVYAAGCVLYELVTGEPPFTGDSPVAVAYQHVREDPNPPSSVNPAVSPELDAVVLKALAKGPANRYQSAAEMRSDLVRTLSGQRPSAPMVMSDDERTQVMNADRRQPQAYDDYADEPDEDPRAKRRRRIIFAAIAALLVAGVVLLIVWLSGSFRDANKEAQIPPVVNTPVPTAKAQLQQAGFSSFADNKTVVCGPEASNPGGQTCSEDQIGKVIAIDPQVGAMVSTSSTITLTVGMKPGNATVPDLRGKSPDDAKSALEQAKLKLGNTTSQPVDNQSDVGKVVSQNPTANSSSPEGTPVDIVVGSGVNQKSVPNTVGQDYESAKQTLENAGFQVKRLDQASDQPKDQVINQQPNGGNLPPNSTVKLTVSSGPQQIKMPDLTGMTEEQATQKLQSLGWSGSVQTQSTSSGSGKPYTVVKQSPQAGSQISPTDAITLTIKEDDGSGPPTSSSGGGIFPPGGIRNNNGG